MFDSPSRSPNTTAWLVYNKCLTLPPAKLVDSFPDFDDTDLEPLKAEPVVQYDTMIPLLINFTSIGGINFATVNNNTYSAPNVPAMLTALTTGANATDPSQYGATTNSFVLNHLDMVWLVINNGDDGGHPCKHHPTKP